MPGIVIPQGVTALGEAVFLNCRSLVALSIPDGVAKIPGQLCYECRSLAQVHLPEGVTEIGYLAFYNCQSLNTISIPSPVSLIENESFKGCTGLTKLAFRGTLASVGDEAFYACAQLSTIHFYGGVDLLGDAVFGQAPALSALYFKCDIPVLADGNTLFVGSDGVTVLYIADPSNWGSTLDGAPVLAWRPEITGLAMVSDKLNITVAWGGDGILYLQACTNLVEGVWFDIDSDVILDGQCEVSDPGAFCRPRCFYRIVHY